MADERLDIRGTSGLAVYGGRVEEEWHPKLSGSLGARVYREMSDNDPIIGAFLYAIESLVRQVEWQVETSADTPEHKAVADFVEEVVDDMSMTWADFVSEALSMLVHGWAYFEIVYKLRDGENKDPRRRSQYSDGRLGWRKLQIIGQTTLDHWEIDADGGIRGLTQLDPVSGRTAYIPIEKALLFRTRSNKNNPEGRSLLRNAYRPWFYKKRIEEIEAIGVERDLAGYPVLEVPPQIMSTTANAAERALRSELETLVQQIKRDEREGVIIPAQSYNGKETGYNLRLLNSGGRRPIDVDAIIKRYESRMAMSVLAEFLLLGTDKVGSFALASTKTDLFAVALGGMLDTMQATINRFALSRLLSFNGFDREVWPEITHGDIEKPDLVELATYVKTLSDTGFDVLDEETERMMRSFGNLPARDDRPAEPTPANVAALASARRSREAGA